MRKLIIKNDRAKSNNNQEIADFIYDTIKEQLSDPYMMKSILPYMKSVIKQYPYMSDLQEYGDDFMSMIFHQDQALFDRVYDRFFAEPPSGKSSEDMWNHLAASDPSNKDSATYTTVSDILRHMERYKHHLSDLLTSSLIKKIQY